MPARFAPPVQITAHDTAVQRIQLRATRAWADRAPNLARETRWQTALTALAANARRFTTWPAAVSPSPAAEARVSRNGPRVKVEAEGESRLAAGWRCG